MHPVKKCIFCGGEVRGDVPGKTTVIGFTEVSIPSVNNEKVPYFVLLLEDGAGNRYLRKTFDTYNIGDAFEPHKEKTKSHVYGVIGTGLLGLQICEFLVTKGYRTIAKTREDHAIDKTLKKLEGKLSRNYSPDAVTGILKRFTVTTSYSDLDDCDIIIEAAPENIAMKQEIFKALSGVCAKKTIFSTNSSSLSIDQLAGVTDRPDRFIGIHFFNPVRRMDLVEVVVGEKTSQVTKNLVISDLVEMGKKPVVVKDSPGYIVNRLLLPQINEAITLLEEGVATKEDIDNAVKLGLNHPMGPFQLADYIGLDICLSILEVLYSKNKTGGKKPAVLLYQLCREGKLGVKTKEGFYKY
jgi:3-hydroxybutyryl-CoA dehydrogenase